MQYAFTVFLIEQKVIKIFFLHPKIHFFQYFPSSTFKILQVMYTMFVSKESVIRFGLGKQEHGVIKIASFLT